MRTAVLLVSFTSAVVASDIPGWRLTGNDAKDFEIHLDRETRHGGSASAALSAVVKHPKGFGTLIQFFRPDEYAGRRVRLSAWVKGSGCKDAAIWMRVDGPSGEVLAFDNRQQNAGHGTFDWKKQELVLDVPPQAAAIYIGLRLSEGRAWVDDFSIEIVDRKVHTTGLTGPRAPNPRGAGIFVDHPALNLDFETQP